MLGFPLSTGSDFLPISIAFARFTRDEIRCLKHMMQIHTTRYYRDIIIRAIQRMSRIVEFTECACSNKCYSFSNSYVRREANIAWKFMETFDRNLRSGRAILFCYKLTCHKDKGDREIVVFKGFSNLRKCVTADLLKSIISLVSFHSL